MADALMKPQPARARGYASGDVIAEKYRLHGLLGEGGQACVWQARNLMLDADVAIKVVRADTNDPAHTGRLLQEARSAARLDHPAIVRVFDLGRTTAGDPFLVMELLEGGTLLDRLYEGGRLSPIEAVRVLLPVADALVAAHSKGLVHRDLKPSNVLLAHTSSTLQPKLLDFGVVKLRGRETEPGSYPLTETGAVIGTPAYFSPEQARGERDIDEYTDIWAYSAMVYECLTGRRPFNGPNYNALLRSILEENPPSILALGVNEPDLWEILKRGLAKTKSERWPSMLALGRALAAWLLERGVVDDICRTSLRSTWLSAEEPPRSAPLAGDSLRGSELAVPISVEAPPSVPHRADPESHGAGTASSVPGLPTKGSRSARLGAAAGAAVVVSIAVFWWTGSAPRASKGSESASTSVPSVSSARPGESPRAQPVEESLPAAPERLRPSTVVPLAPLPIVGSASPSPNDGSSPQSEAPAPKKPVVRRPSNPEPTSPRAPRKAGDELDLLAPY